MAPTASQDVLAATDYPNPEPASLYTRTKQLSAHICGCLLVSLVGFLFIFIGGTFHGLLGHVLLQSAIRMLPGSIYASASPVIPDHHTVETYIGVMSLGSTEIALITLIVTVCITIAVHMKSPLAAVEHAIDKPIDMDKPTDMVELRHKLMGHWVYPRAWPARMVDMAICLLVLWTGVSLRVVFFEGTEAFYDGEFPLLSVAVGRMAELFLVDSVMWAMARGRQTVTGAKEVVLVGDEELAKEAYTGV